MRRGHTKSRGGKRGKGEDDRKKGEDKDGEQTGRG